MSDPDAERFVRRVVLVAVAMNVAALWVLVARFVWVAVR